MYLNRITLIGFIGSDAERKAANATNIAIFSLATKMSWKNDAGSWESRTEWHRCVAFGKLADFVGNSERSIRPDSEWQAHGSPHTLTADKPISSAAIVRKNFTVSLGDGSRLSPPFLVLWLPSTLDDARLREPSGTIFRVPDDTSGARPVGSAAES